MKKKLVAIEIISLLMTFCFCGCGHHIKHDNVVFKRCSSVFEFRDMGFTPNKIEGVVILAWYEKSEQPPINSFALAVGFIKPLKSYFGYQPLDIQGRPVPLETDRNYVEKLTFFECKLIDIMGALGASIGYVVKEDKHYTCYLIGISETNNEVMGRLFVSKELKQILLELFKIHKINWETFNRD